MSSKMFKKIELGIKPWCLLPSSHSVLAVQSVPGFVCVESQDSTVFIC